ncbi:hypothetical protein HDU97_001867 [Phlyctochytrium planicorne]|nr:hypothetical protein HDU97_001867 [Phlyctochytrium planicorne]
MVEVNEWELKWRESRTGWDQGGATPAFKNVLDSILPELLAKKSSLRALVPGCGRGYDVVEFASRGIKALGIDLSETGLQEAVKYRDEKKIDAELAELQLVNFFEWTPEKAFDIIFDHTFLCALEKKLRSEWASKISSLVVPGGLLIAYMFPLRADDDEVETYKSLLSHEFEEVFIRDLTAEEEVPKDRKHLGAEKMSLWRKK